MESSASVEVGFQSTALRPSLSYGHSSQRSHWHVSLATTPSESGASTKSPGDYVHVKLGEALF